LIAEIIGVGAGLAAPGMLDENTRLIARELEACEIRVNHSVPVGVNVPQLRCAIAQALGRSDVVILLGGLSAGADGITKETVCEGLGKRLVLHEDSLRRIREAYQRAGRQMPQQVARLAMLPEQSVVFPGVRGITPGCALSAGSQYIIMIPDTPKEFVPMLQNSVIPYLARFSEAAVVTRTVNVFGLDETSAAEKLGELLRSENPAVTIHQNKGELLVRITARGKNKREATAVSMPMLQKVVNFLGEAAYGTDQKNLQSAVANLLLESRMRVSAGESGTGGLLADWFTALSGAEGILRFGVSANTGKLKEESLHVPKKLLRKFGPVSAQTAAAMAAGAMQEGQSELGVGITAGVGEEPKKTGLIYVAVCDRENVWVQKLDLPKKSEPDYIRYMACMAALDLLRRYIMALPGRMEGASSRKAAAAGKLAAVLERESGDGQKKRKNGKKRPWYAKIFPVKGDDGAEIVRKLILLLAVAIFLTSIGYLGNFQLQSKRNKSLQSDLETMYVEGMSEQDATELEIPDNYPEGYQKKFANLYKLNEDVAGWLKIPGTNVSYPVVQYEDNDYYMRRDFNRKPSKYGVPWLEAADEMNPQSANYVIYGHNMTDGQMFGELMNYKGQNGLTFLQEHPIVEFDDVYRDNTYKIFSVFITNAKSQYGEVFYYNEATDFADDAAFTAFVQEVKDRSYYDSNVDVQPGDHLITLSTCSYEFGPVSDDAHVRTVIVARKVRPGEKDDGSDVSYQWNPDYKLPPGFVTGGTAAVQAAAPASMPASASSTPASSAPVAVNTQTAAAQAEAASKAASDAAASKAAAEAASKAASDAAASKAAAEAASKAASDAAASKAAAEAASKAASDAAASKAAAEAAQASRQAAEEASRKASEQAESSRIASEEAEASRQAAEEAARVEEEEDDEDEDIRTSGSGSDKLTIVSGGRKVSGRADDIVAKVVMNEMGTGFNDEALKAQAVAAYTFIKQQNASGITPALGTKKPSSQVQNAVDEVIGEAVYYKNNLAFTPFYATSAGVTISSKDVWGGSYAYLVPVDSEIDEQARNYEYTVTMTADKVADRVEDVLGVDLWDFSDDPDDWFDIRSYTEGDRYVKEIKVGKKTTTGRVVREQVLGLRSAAFEIDYSDSTEKFTFTTYGYGHGVGMSQTGANLYANEEGWDYEEILTHYYPGCKVK